MSVTKAKGFKAAYTKAGIKYEGRDDMAMIVCDVPANYAACFTKNVVKAAPVLWDRAILESGKKVRSVVINAGIANACTGDAGLSACEQTAEYMAGQIGDGCTREEVAVASTGVIGMQLPVDRICNGISAMYERLSDSDDAAHGAALAIMTTDTKPKEVSTKVTVGGKAVTIGGMAKGSGMIHPNMGTMLSFITTDCAISAVMMQEVLQSVVADTYNMISVDGDTSTNDSCLMLSSGLANNPTITQKNADYEAFEEALRYVNMELAKMMAGDGEGATALFETKVVGAASKEEAKTLAKSVITSSLTKAAIFGHDANWGRILCALGYAGVAFDPYKVDIFVSGNEKSLQLVRDGIATDYSEEEATDILSAKHVIVTCDVKMGQSSASAYGCDLSYDYVKINADYRS